MKNELVKNVSQQQKRFLKEYASSGSVSESLERSGMTRSNFNRDTLKDGAFSIKFDTLMNKSLMSYGLSKIKSLKTLEKIRDASVDDPDLYGVAIKAIKMMASMQEDHLAVVRKIEEKKIININAVIDFTKPIDQEMLTEDVGYEDADYKEIEES